MKFVDEVKIYVKAGDGGKGCCSFRREKFVPRGGPDGGNGGTGGNVKLIASKDVSTLLDLYYKKVYKAQRGKHGKGNNQTGKNGNDLNVRVPLGSIITDLDTQVVIGDLTKENDVLVVAKGGKGGRGNARFASSVNQAPHYSEDGKPGDERWLLLELKLLADVGIIGFPNVGKSTLISRITAVKPKIEDYPFTTLIPNIGVVSISDDKSFVVADIPGLIEGAHKGSGLGIRFLKHVERTKLLVHVIDISDFVNRDPVNDLAVINKELSLFSEELASKPQIVTINKLDLYDVRKKIPSTIERFRQLGIEVQTISSVTGEGIEKLLFIIWDTLKSS
ncbi:MAG: GTPase ObgE [Thermodesulfobacteriota bacterium]|nr:GTPase ObgE [Thermodesulfobacteriota bacterium]